MNEKTQASTAKKTTKTQVVEKLLGRRSGASIAEIQEKTDWKPHSVRAFLSGLRRRGSIIDRELHKTKGSIYRIRKASGANGALAACDTAK